MTTESGWNRETGLAGLAAGAVRRAQQHQYECEQAHKEADAQVIEANNRYAAALAALQEGVAGGEQ